MVGLVLLSLLCSILIIAIIVDIRKRRCFDSNTNYDGQIVINTTDDGKTVFSLELDKDPEELKNQKTISFEVKTENSTGYDDV